MLHGGWNTIMWPGCSELLCRCWESNPELLIAFPTPCSLLCHHSLLQHTVLCTNFVYKLLFFSNTMNRLVCKMCSPVLSDCFYFTLFSLVFSFSLYGAVLSALHALLHPQTVVSYILYTLHLYFELLGKQSEVKWRLLQVSIYNW